MKDKVITVTVETMDGEQVSIRVNLENKVEKLMREAAKELGIDADVRLYDLTFEGQRQDPDVKIEATGIRDNSKYIYPVS